MSHFGSAGAVTCCDPALAPFTPPPPSPSFIVVHFSPLKAVRCDAFNINHMQRTGRTHCSVCPLQSALSLGAGHASLRSAALWCQWAALQDVQFISPLPQTPKLGLDTFSTTFSADSARTDLEGSTQPRNSCGFLQDTYRKHCLDGDFILLLHEKL